MYLFFLIYNGVKRKVCKPQILAYNPARKLLFQVNYLMPIQNSTALNEQSHPGTVPWVSRRRLCRLINVAAILKKQWG